MSNVSRWVLFVLTVAMMFGGGRSSAQDVISGVPRTVIGSAVTVERAVNDALGLRASSVQSLRFRGGAGSRVMTDVEVDGAVWTLDLVPYSVRGDAFEVLVPDADTGELLTFPMPPPSTYRGIVRGMDGVDVRASFANGRLRALIHTPEGLIGIQPISDAGVVANRSAHVVYRAANGTGLTGRSCGTVNVAVPGGGMPVGTPAAAGTGLRVCDLAIDADFSFFRRHASDVIATVQDIEDVINGVEPIYEVPEIGITYEIATVIVRTVSGTYTTSDANGLLCQFRSRWNGIPESGIRRDTAHLFTGRDLNGSTVGVAFVGSVCNVIANAAMCSRFGNIGYGLSESLFLGATYSERVALTAHELAHNWNAQHCTGPSCNIMCANIGACSRDITTFSAASASVVSAFADSRTCLSDLINPITLPFSDSFASSGQPDGTRWSFNRGGNVTTTAVGEPSGPRSLNLDAAVSSGALPFQRDEIRSNFMLLGGEVGVVFSYHTEHRGVAAGGQLVVEYWSSDRRWVELNRLTSDGTDQTTFAAHFHFVPPDAYHDEFRIRFRTEVDGFGEDWFVDDVELKAGCTPFGDVNNDFVVDTSDLQCILDALNGDVVRCSFADADISPCGGNGVVNLFDILGVVRSLRGDPQCSGSCG